MSKNTINIHWKPDKNSHLPAYIQIADHCTENIQSGNWPEGSFLPSQRELAKLFQVNRSTVTAALEELKSAGLVDTHGKGGTRVASCMMPAYASKSPDWTSHIAEGFHLSNLETIQIINRNEFSEGFIRLSSGEPSPELFPKEMMTEIMMELGSEMTHLGYEEPKGMLYLREQICRYVDGFGIKTRPENVLIVSGALQAIQLISMGILQPGSTVFLEKPSYLYSLNIFQSIGMRRQAIGMDAEGVMAHELSALRPKHRQAMLYTVPCFHNPTGILMSKERRKELIEVCGRAQIPIIEDDVYRELWLEEEPPEPIKSLDSHGNVLYVGSASKTLSTGLRIGWLIGPESVVDRLGDLKMQNDYGSSSLSQLAVGKFFEKGYYAAHGQLVRTKLKERRQVAGQALKKHFSQIATWEEPKGGYYYWITFKVPIRMPLLFHEAFKVGILAYPGYLYDSSMNDSLRLSYSYATLEELEKGIERLAQLALSLIGR